MVRKEVAAALLHQSIAIMKFVSFVFFICVTVFVQGSHGMWNKDKNKPPYGEPTPLGNIGNLCDDETPLPGCLQARNILEKNYGIQFTVVKCSQNKRHEWSGKKCHLKLKPNKHTEFECYVTLAPDGTYAALAYCRSPYGKNINEIRRMFSSQAGNSVYGQPNYQTGGGYGQPNNQLGGGYGSMSTNTYGTGYGRTNTPLGGGYGQTNAPLGGGYGQTNTPLGGGYGQTNTPLGGGYGQTNVAVSGYGQPNNVYTPGVGSYGTPNNQVYSSGFGGTGRVGAWV